MKNWSTKKIIIAIMKKGLLEKKAQLSAGHRAVIEHVDDLLLIISPGQAA